MKNICFMGFNLLTVSGCQKVTVSLANVLSKNNNVHLLSLCKLPNEKCYNANNNIQISSFNLSPDVRVRESLGQAFNLVKFLNSNNIDILILSGVSAIPMIAIIKPFIKCKVIFWDHENLAGRDKKSILFRKLACKVSDKTVVLSEQTLKDYKSYFKIENNKIEQIYNYTDFQNNNQCNLNSKKIISVGRINPEKGFDMAVDVARKVFKKHNDWQWDIYGDGTDFNKITGKIKEYGLENNLILKGNDNNIREKYKDYSIFVLPSYREGFALVLLEAKMNKLPVVSFDCNAGPNEIINDGVDGYLIPCYNKDEMCKKICELIENKSLRAKFSEHSQDNLYKFGKEKIISKWNKLLSEI